MIQLNFQPVVIIGAARSGTNMVRDLLTALPGVGSWPCDEINYIWRHGNARFETDELPAELATPKVTAFVRKKFARQAAKLKCSWLVEKTCANSLRVDFVSAILPEAKFIFLVRDGSDVSLSAEKRWQAPLDFSYLYKKAAFVPWSDLPYYAGRYAWHRCCKWFDRERRLPTWGPRCRDLDKWSRELSSREVSLRQWQACVELASEALSRLPRERVHYVRYEAFVREPVQHLRGLCSFLSIKRSQQELIRLAQSVARDRVGHGSKKDITNSVMVVETLDRIEAIWCREQHSLRGNAA
jgi:hypothetical protein